MRLNFLYKIWSDYDGFTPADLPNRLERGDLLELGWRNYLEVVEKGAEVWIYFHGRQKYVNGVYARGFVHGVDLGHDRVVLRVQEFSTDQPLTDTATSARVADAVRPRGRQVFLFPDDLEPTPDCDLYGEATSCAARECANCVTWKRLPLIKPKDHYSPERMGSEIATFSAGWWVIPSRCYLPASGLQPGIRTTSRVFYRFKIGAEALAYPLALAAFQALHADARTVDAVVPIPLSPDKAKHGEINRTRLLANELGHLLGSPVAEVLTLNKPISKRKLGLAPAGFEKRYQAALEVKPRAGKYDSVLLVDDVATRGSTLEVAARALQATNPDMAVHAVCAGQMIVKPVVTDKKRLLAR